MLYSMIVVFLIYSIKQNDELSLSSYNALNGIYSNNESFIGTNKETMRTSEDRQMIPACRIAMLEVCYLSVY